MPSEVRLEVFKTMEQYREILQPDNRGWKVLEVGTDGDPAGGGNHEYFGKGNTYETMDYLERLHPTYVADIQDTKLDPEMFDLVICSQTLEHVFEPIKAIKEIARITKSGGYAIIDSPFTYPYHPASGYDDYWRMTIASLKRIAVEAGFSVVVENSTTLLSSLLVRR